ncbi:MAG: hydroxymethylglutaryl-CoA synthase family protein [Candidatus Lokiarchaeota archaeon]|nr:hydroxymethylglutaryl-CoA synthase family protein [Candidatus Lokiarchaeota archaeon]
MTEITNNDFFFNVGIDSMGFYTSKYYVDLRELAEVRNVDPDKYLRGLLTTEMRIPGPGEDIVSMAVKAGHYALHKGNINPEEIDAIFLGTETMTYAVKSIANVLSEIFGTTINCVTQDVYNACAGATLAVLNAIGLINNGIINKALIIGADISHYKLESPGEPTQGAAAAAVVISKNPRVAAFGKNFGKYTANIYDFYRLPYEDYPVVFGKYSIDSYLKFQLGAFDDFFKNARNILPDYLAFHSPFAKLPLKNIQNLLLNRWETLKKILLDKQSPNACPVMIHDQACDVMKDMIEPIFENMKVDDKYQNIESMKIDLINSLTNRFLPTLNVPMSIGNMYSASIWAQLIYLLENIVNQNDLIYFGSYGSGATCISGMLKVMPSFKQIVEKGPKVMNFIENKERKTVQEYEEMREKIDAKKIHHARIEPHPSPKNYFVEIGVCEGGCLVSKLEGLDFCPRGTNKTHKKRLPMYAVVATDPTHDMNENELSADDVVRVSPDVKKGQTVEYNMLRAGKNESAHCVQTGFITWIPTYKPINYPIE